MNRRLSASTRPEGGAQRLAVQRRFFKRLGTDQPFRQLFEHLHGVYFFAKDTNSRLMAATPPIVERLGGKEEKDIIGASDDEFFPPQIAENFVRDDRRVIRTGQPLIGRVEIWYSEQHVFDWFVTNKVPLRDAKGRVIGIAGTIQSYSDRRKTLLPCQEIARVVDYIHAHRQGRVTVTELARLAGLSPRQLSRRFHEVLGMSLQDFVMKSRVQGAADVLVSTDRTIAGIAQSFGFCDQSAFTRQFRKHTGITPRKYRLKYSSMTGS